MARGKKISGVIDQAPATTTEPDSITLKLEELRQSFSVSSMMTRRNYAALLANCPPDLFDKIVKRLMLAAVTDQSGQAAFAALQYLVGKPIPISSNKDEVLEEMRTLLRLQLANTVDKTIAETTPKV